MSDYAIVWDLDSILPHPKTEEFQSSFQKFRTDLTGLAERSEMLPTPNAHDNTVSSWRSFLKDYEAIVCQSSELASFIGCHAAADAVQTGQEADECAGGEVGKHPCGHLEAVPQEPTDGEVPASYRSRKAAGTCRGRPSAFTCAVPMICRMKVMNRTPRSCGIVTCHTLRHTEAPSTSAASYSSPGTEVSAAR